MSEQASNNEAGSVRPGAIPCIGEIVGIGLWLYPAFFRLCHLIVDAMRLGIGNRTVTVTKLQKGITETKVDWSISKACQGCEVT